MSKFKIEHIALDMAFYHELISDLRPAPGVIEAFELDKEHAEIFRQKETDTAFSQVEILNWFLLQTHTTIADHLPHTRNNEPQDDKPQFVTFPIRFAPNTFSLETEEGEQDLSHLKLMCKVSKIHTDA